MKKLFLLAVLLAVPVSASEVYESAESTSLVAVNSVIIADSSDKLAISEAFELEAVKCLCVAYARLFMPSIPYPMNADELVPNGTGDLGNGILLDYSGVRHLAVIQGFTDEGWKVTEANKLPCQITERVISWSDENIVGFIKA